MDIELVEKKPQQENISLRSISQNISEDEIDNKSIFWTCLLIKLTLIIKCCLISKMQFEKCLEGGLTESNLSNISTCVIYIFITLLPSIQLLFPNTIITNKLFNHLLGRFLYFFTFFILSENDWNRLMYPSLTYLIVWLIGDGVHEKLINELLY